MFCLNTERSLISVEIMTIKTNARFSVLSSVTSYSQLPSMDRFISGYTGLCLHLFIYIPLHLCSLIFLLSLHLLSRHVSFAFNLHQIIGLAETAKSPNMALEPEYEGYISGYSLCSDLHRSPVNILSDIKWSPEVNSRSQ